MTMDIQDQKDAAPASAPPSTREKIEREALRLFAEKGFDGTSVRDISQAVGVADGALYRHFKSKDDIARKIFAHHYRALAQDIIAVAARQLPFRQTVRALVDLFCALFDESPDVFAFILLNQHAHLRFIGEADNAVVPLRTIMQEAFIRGEIRIANPDLASAMALGTVLQPGVFKLYGHLPGPMSAHAEALANGAAAAVGAT
jgi:AcrR family transcriptional regulator